MQQEARKALISANIVSSSKLDEAATQSRFNRKSILINLYEESDLATQKAITETLARFYKIPLLSLEKIRPSPSLVRKCKPEQARQWHFLPIVDHGEEVVIGMLDPTDLNNVDTLRHVFRKPIQPVFIYAHDFERGLYRFFRKGKSIPVENDNLLDTTQLKNVLGGNDAQSEQSDQDTQTIANKFSRHILSRALASGASDLLIEPAPHETLISLRIEGGTYRLFRLASSHHERLVSAFRDLARLSEANTGTSQRSSFRLQYHNRELRLLMHIQPSPHGERISVRIIDPQTVSLNLEQLALPKSTRENIESVLAGKSGLMLVTGPSGSGKSTVISAYLRHMAASGWQKMISIEDLVIEKISGVRQAQFPASGINKSSVIDSALKHAPEVLALDEAADVESVRKAVKLAEKALVILSIEADGIPEALARLLRFGLDRDLLSSVLQGIYTQKVIRRICPECKSTNLIHPKTIQQMNIPASFSFHAGNGCSNCKETGYKGTLTVSEFMTFTPEISSRLAEGASGAELYTDARYDGMLTLFESGLNKAIDGSTSLEEVLAMLPSPAAFDFSAQVQLGRIGPLKKPAAAGGADKATDADAQSIEFNSLFEQPEGSDAASTTSQSIMDQLTESPEPTAEEIEAVEPAASPESDKLSVLLLDDSPVMLQYTSHILSSCGLFEIQTAGGVDEAWDKLQQYHFHLVITDHEMPVQSGQEFIERIRMQPSLNHTGTMLLTGNLKEASALSGGADGYVSKPTDPELLIARAKSIAEIYKRMSTQADATSKPAPVTSKPAAQRTNGNNDANRTTQVDFSERDMDRIGSLELDTRQFGGEAGMNGDIQANESIDP